MAKKYKHLFFDLDRTLWDFEKSALEAFKIMHKSFNLESKRINDWREFHEKYEKHNLALWDMYRHGKIEKEQLRWKRFADTLQEYGINNQQLAKELGDEYVRLSPRIVNLYPHVLEVLDYLSKKYHLHIITNGFEEVQHIKLQTSGMDKFFDVIVTSEKAGIKKPDTGIFEFALKNAHAKKEESLMIGDDYEVDILGAKAAGIDQVFFSPNNENNELISTYAITDMIDLKNFL